MHLSLNVPSPPTFPKHSAASAFATNMPRMLKLLLAAYNPADTLIDSQ